MVKAIPKLQVIGTEMPFYNDGGYGATQNVFLVGHADGLPLNTPIQANSIRNTVDLMNRDTNSPLLRGLLEAYYSGARDIWLVAAAPMEEYAEPEDRDEVFYQTYKNRLDETYSVLEYWDNAHITVPLTAPLNEYRYETDFLTQLVHYCVRAFWRSGDIHLGIMGTEGHITSSVASTIKADARLNNSEDTVDDVFLNSLERWAAAKKMVAIFAGDVVYNMRELPFAHSASVAPAIAGMISQLRMEESVINKNIPKAARLPGNPLNKSEADSLALMGVNPLDYNANGRRGQPYTLSALTDNTLSEDGSSFWSLTQLRAIAIINRDIRAIGNKFIGQIGYEDFKKQVRDYLVSLVMKGHIRSYDVKFQRDNDFYGSVNVDLSIMPYFSVRNIDVSILTGPQKA